MAWFFKRNGIDVNYDGIFGEATAEVATYNLAIHTAIDLIAKTIAKCEFQIYEKNKTNKSDNYYLFNYEPNINQNATQFWYKVIENLLFNGEALVIQENDKFYVADSFTKETPTFVDWRFKDVQIGELTLRKTYLMKDVFYFSYSTKNMEYLLNQFYKSYGKMLGASIKHFNRSKASKWIYKFKTALQSDTTLLEERIRTNIGKFADADDKAVLPLGEGNELVDTSSKVAIDSRDTKNLIDDIFSIVAMAFHIPKSILTGEGLDTSDNTSNFITFALEPIIELIQDEVNRKYFGRKGFDEGNFFKIYANRIKHVDIINAAQKLESLFRIGFSFNDLQKILGEEPIDEPWANERFITKNYMTAAQTMKGGE